MPEEQQAAQQQSQAAAIESSELSALLTKEFKPKSDRAKEAVDKAV